MRIARLEEQMHVLVESVSVMRAEQTEHAEMIARAVGGAKVLMVLSTLGGVFLTFFRTITEFLSSGGPRH